MAFWQLLQQAEDPVQLLHNAVRAGDVGALEACLATGRDDVDAPGGSAAICVSIMHLMPMFGFFGELRRILRMHGYVPRLGGRGGHGTGGLGRGGMDRALSPST